MNIHLKNARIVRQHAVEEGDLWLSEAVFAEKGVAAPAHAIDCDGDFLIPGLIDIHTDHIEHYVHPRPGVTWPSKLRAVLAHDRQLTGSGITTVLDALSLGDYDSSGERTTMLESVIHAVTDARSAGLLKADHFFHFGCELSDPGMMPLVERHIDNGMLRLASLMDHTPGQRQWHDLTLFREFRRTKNAQVWSDDEFAVYLAERQQHQSRLVTPSRGRIGQLCEARNIR